MRFPAGLLFQSGVFVLWLGSCCMHSVLCALDFLADGDGPRAAPASCMQELWPVGQLKLSVVTQSLSSDQAQCGKRSGRSSIGQPIPALPSCRRPPHTLASKLSLLPGVPSLEAAFHTLLPDFCGLNCTPPPKTC